MRLFANLLLRMGLVHKKRCWFKTWMQFCKKWLSSSAFICFFDSVMFFRLNGRGELYTSKPSGNPSIIRKFRSEVDPDSLHDVTCCVYGSSARDVARHFIQLWNTAQVEVQKRQKKSKTKLLIPKTYDDTDESTWVSTYLAIEPSQLKICAVTSTVSPFLSLYRADDGFECSVQVVRSACFWSAGLRQAENSIFSAILSAIRDAQHFIYIENHFAVNPIDKDKEIENEVIDALIQKIYHMYMWVDYL